MFMVMKQHLVFASLSDVKDLWAPEKTCTMMQNNHKVSNCFVRDAAHRLYQGVLYCRNIIRFLGARGNIMLFRPLRQLLPSLPDMFGNQCHSINCCGHSCRLQLKCDGTRWRTGGEVKGKLANGVGSQYPSHYFGTWCIQHYYQQ